MKVGDDIQIDSTSSTTMPDISRGVCNYESTQASRHPGDRNANATRNSQDKIQVSMVKGESKVSTRYNQVTVVAEM